MMMVVVPTQLLTSIIEKSLWLLFPFSNLEFRQAYLQCVKLSFMVFEDRIMIFMSIVS